MRISELTGMLDLTAHTHIDEDKSFDCCYVGDLLSWAISHAPKNCALVTIMNNLNVLAAAELINASCVILAEGVKPSAELIDTASARGICLLSCTEPAFTICFKIAEGLKR